MSQIDFKSYAILGAGRVASHLQSYFNHLGLPYASWSRRDGMSAAEFAKPHTHLLLAVKDSAIECLSQELAGLDKIRIHFSGALRIPGVRCAHPLMSFPLEPRPLAWYQQIPFVIDRGTSLEELLPGLKNSSFAIDPETRVLYHTLCSLAGNSSFLLWQTIGAEFQRLGLPSSILEPYLNETVHSATHTSVAGGLTGPVARGDWAVVRSHLGAIADRIDLTTTYKSYLALAQHHGCHVPEDLFNEHS